MMGGSVSLIVTTLGRFSILRDQDLLSGGNWNRRRVCELFKLLLSAEQHRMHSGPIKEQQLQSTLDAFDNVLALYGGDYLLDDLYEDWAQRRRDRLRRTYS